MVKSASAAWLWFLGLFVGIFSLLATGLFLQHRQTSIKLDKYRDTLATYKQLYQKLKKDYLVLSNKYQLALRSALEGDQQLRQLGEELQRQQDSLQKIYERLEKIFVGYSQEQLKVIPKNGQLYVRMRDTLLFPLGSAQVQPAGVKALGKLAKVLKQSPDLKIIIRGHTDNIPIKPGTKCWKDNWDLSAARAISVARILINKYGIAPERIEIAGKAQYEPVVPNVSPKNRALNRRIDIVIMPDLSKLYEIIQK